MRVQFVFIPILLGLAGCSTEKDRPKPPAGPAPGPPPAILLTPIARVPQNLPSTLKPGEFFWKPEAVPQGPTTLVVSLTEQRGYVYRNGVAIGVTTVSSGKKGHRTPTGVFTILQKKEKHTSNIYNAPMPFMQRLTWSGIALHAGALPGYPASHGCIRLPIEFAKQVFQVTDSGTTVIISDRNSSPDEIVYPGLLAPRPQGEVESIDEPLKEGEFEWRPQSSPEGPVTVLLSRPDRTIYVYRNGVQIGRSRVVIRRPLEPLGDIIFTVLEGTSDKLSPMVPGKPALRLLGLGLSDESRDILKEDIYRRVTVPEAFAAKVYELLKPGTTILVTDMASTRETQTSRDFTIVTAEGATAKP